MKFWSVCVFDLNKKVSLTQVFQLSNFSDWKEALLEHELINDDCDIYDQVDDLIRDLNAKTEAAGFLFDNLGLAFDCVLLDLSVDC